jgi:hypothetical protein
VALGEASCCEQGGPEAAGAGLVPEQDTNGKLNDDRTRPVTAANEVK